MWYALGYHAVQDCWPILWYFLRWNVVCAWDIMQYRIVDLSFGISLDEMWYVLGISCSTGLWHILWYFIKWNVVQDCLYILWNPCRFRLYEISTDTSFEISAFGILIHVYTCNIAIYSLELYMYLAVVYIYRIFLVTIHVNSSSWSIIYFLILIMTCMQSDIIFPGLNTIHIYYITFSHYNSVYIHTREVHTLHNIKTKPL